MTQIITQSRERFAQGFWIVIYPEGTRIKAGTRAHYKTGGARLAVALGVPIVPVAHNAGYLWPKGRLGKRPGTITVSIGPPISVEGHDMQRLINEVGGNGFLASGKERERQRTAAVKQSRALAPLHRKRLLVASAPFGQRFDHPLSPLSQRKLDLAYRHPRRRAHAEPALIDLHADGSAPRSIEAVVDALVAQRDAAHASGVASAGQARGVTRGSSGFPSRATSSSIQASTSLISRCMS